MASDMARGPGAGRQRPKTSTYCCASSCCAGSLAMPAHPTTAKLSRAAASGSSPACSTRAASGLVGSAPAASCHDAPAAMDAMATAAMAPEPGRPFTVSSARFTVKSSVASPERLKARCSSSWARAAAKSASD
eukprot:scaffold1627_cov126-Isochrysis_galbana.AAC.2